MCWTCQQKSKNKKIFVKYLRRWFFKSNFVPKKSFHVKYMRKGHPSYQIDFPIKNLSPFLHCLFSLGPDWIEAWVRWNRDGGQFYTSLDSFNRLHFQHILWYGFNEAASFFDICLFYKIWSILLCGMGSLPSLNRLHFQHILWSGFIFQHLLFYKISNQILHAWNTQKKETNQSMFYVCIFWPEMVTWREKYISAPPHNKIIFTSSAALTWQANKYQPTNKIKLDVESPTILDTLYKCD